MKTELQPISERSFAAGANDLRGIDLYRDGPCFFARIHPIEYVIDESVVTFHRSQATFACHSADTIEVVGSRVQLPHRQECLHRIFAELP